jgi:hypothetical protein
MAPQFVDFNADGHLDIVTGTFDGSPHVALGSPEGFLPPNRILDAKGERVLLTQFWNYDAEKWDDTDRAVTDNADGQLHCISAVAFDWDNDGDLDLLMGDKNHGRLFRQMNEGTNAAPAFTGINIPVLASGKPFEIAGGMTAPELVDWDGDGLTDLLCGGFGDSYSEGAGSGIFWYRNTGSLSAPEFAAPVTLIPISSKDAVKPMRPDSGLYVEAADYDGNGSLDLIVGGYSHWKPAPRVLTDEEKQRIVELEAQQQELMQQLSDFQSKALEAVKDVENEDERNEKFRESMNSEAYRDLVNKLQPLYAQLKELNPGMERESFVWLYLRKGDAEVTAAGK